MQRPHWLPEWWAFALTIALLVAVVIFGSWVSYT